MEAQVLWGPPGACSPPGAHGLWDTQGWPCVRAHNVLWHLHRVPHFLQGPQRGVDSQSLVLTPPRTPETTASRWAASPLGRPAPRGGLD